MGHTTTSKAVASLLAGGLVLGLGACNSSSSGGGGETAKHTVSGELSGLGPDSLVVSINGDEVTFTEDGELELAEIDEGSDYTLDIVSQPASPLQDCSADPASGTVTGDVTISLSCITPVAMSGKVTAGAADGSTVTLTVGGQTFTASVAGGEYSLEADIEDPWALMRLDAGEAEWRFRSHLGSVVGVHEKEALPTADDRNQIGELQTGRANLNHLNTAIAGQLEWHHGGSDFGDHDTLVDVSRDLLSQDAATVAGALRMVTEDGEPLPAWAANTLEVAQDVPEALNWISGLGTQTAGANDTTPIAQKLLAKEQRSIQPIALSNASTLDTHKAAALDEASVDDGGYTSLPESMFATGGHAFGYYSYAAQFDFLASQAWMRESTGGIVNGPFSFSNGEVHINFQSYPDPYAVWETWCPDGSGGQERCTAEYYYQDVIIDRVMDGLNGDLVTREQTTLVTYDSPNAPDEVRTDQIFVSLMVPGDNIPLDTTNLEGEIALAFPPERYREHDGLRRAADVVDLANGGSGELNHYQDPIVWEVRSEGELEIRPTGGSEVYKGWMLSGGDDGEGYMLMNSYHSNSAGIVADRAMRRDDSLFFTSADLTGHWVLWQDESLPHNIDFVLDYDNSANPNLAYLGDSTALADYPWRIEFDGDPVNATFHLARCATNTASGWEFSAPSSIGLPADPSAEPDCDLMYNERTWQIIREEAGRLYMTEKQRTWIADGGAWNLNLEQDTIRYFGDDGGPVL